jgi:hypothetical protein
MDHERRRRRDLPARLRHRALHGLPSGRGLALFEAWSAALPAEQPLHEPVDAFVFRR